MSRSFVTRRSSLRFILPDTNVFVSIVGQRMVCWRKRASTPNAMFVVKSNSGSKSGAGRHSNR